MVVDTRDMIVCDIGYTLDVREARPLAKKIAQIREEGKRLVLATDGRPEVIRDTLFLIGMMGLKVDETDVISSFNLGIFKREDTYWEKFLALFKADAKSITFIDDDTANCENAKKHGIDTIQFNRYAVPDCIEKLDRKFHPLV